MAGLRSLLAWWLGGAGKSGPPEDMAATGQVTLSPLSVSGTVSIDISGDGSLELPSLTVAGSGDYQFGEPQKPEVYVYHDIHLRATRLRQATVTRVRHMRPVRARHITVERVKA